ncbi:MAG: galactose mutarotase [Clostridia bacterium]|nr:galactose mutarotase [Clostridia bacterium]
MIKISSFGRIKKTPGLRGKTAHLFELSSPESRLKLTVSDFGARVVGLSAVNPDGSETPLAACYRTLYDCETAPGYLGATVGRFANRISGAGFELGGKRYELFANNGECSLHGGQYGFDRKLCDYEIREDAAETDSVTFYAFSRNGDEGYPGNLVFTVRYSLEGDSGFRIDYTAQCDRDTPLGFTNHTYFTLGNKGGCEDFLMTADADRFLPVDSRLVPLGHAEPVAGGCFDFRREKPISECLNSGDGQISAAGGIDHCFIFPEGGGFCERVTVRSPATGIAVTMSTDRPAVQIYTGNFMDEITSVLSDGAVPVKRHAICLESEGYPDAPNNPGFPSCVLRAGDTFRSSTSYAFSFDNR